MDKECLTKEEIGIVLGLQEVQNDLINHFYKKFIEEDSVDEDVIDKVEFLFDIWNSDIILNVYYFEYKNNYRNWLDIFKDTMLVKLAIHSVLVSYNVNEQEVINAMTNYK